MRNNYDTKRRYKMYKAGKAWLYAPLLFLSFGAWACLIENQAQAATNAETMVAPVVNGSDQEMPTRGDVSRELQLRTPATPTVETTTTTEAAVTVAPRATKPAVEKQEAIPGLVKEGDGVYYYKAGDDGKTGTEKATGWTPVPGRENFNDYNFGDDGNLTPSLQGFQKDAEWLAQVMESKEEAEPYFKEPLSTLSQSIEQVSTTLEDKNHTPVAMLDRWDGLQKAVHGILQAVLDQEKVVMGTEAFKNAPEEARDAYLKAVHEAGEIQFDNPNVSPDEVAQKVNDILTLRDQLSGKKMVVSKDDLKKAVDEAPMVKKTPQYFNASESAKQSYDQLVVKGQEVLNQAAATQPMVDEAYQKLEEAQNKLDGKPTDPAKLQALLAESTKTKKTTAYLNASKEQREAYDAKVFASVVMNTEVVNNKNMKMITQAMVDQLAGEFEVARTALDGNRRPEMKTADLRQLQKVVAEAEKVRGLHTYYNAPANLRKAYDDKVAAGDALLKQAAPSQPLVDAAFREIVNEKAALNGQATDPTALKAAVAAAVKEQKTVNYTAAAKDRQTTFDAKLKAAVAMIQNLEKITQVAADQLAAELEATQGELDGDKRQLQQMKKAFKQMILEAQAKKAAEIANGNLPADQMKGKLAEIKQRAEAAQQAIDAGTTTAEVTVAKNAGIKAIAAVTTTAPERPMPAPGPENPMPAPEKPVEPMMPMPEPDAPATPAPDAPMTPAPTPLPERPITPEEPQAPQSPAVPEQPMTPEPMAPAPEQPTPAPTPDTPVAPQGPSAPEPMMPTLVPDAPVEPMTPSLEQPMPTPQAEHPTGGKAAMPSPTAMMTPRAPMMVSGGTQSVIRGAGMKMAAGEKGMVLPQTGEGSGNAMGVLGMTLTGIMMSLFGMEKLKRHKR